MFPQLPLQPAFSWAGTFAGTEDGLPSFGARPKHGPRVLFAMACGSNGITYSRIGAGLLRAAIERRKHPLSALFPVQRPAPAPCAISQALAHHGSGLMAAVR